MDVVMFVMRGRLQGGTSLSSKTLFIVGLLKQIMIFKMLGAA